MASVTLDRTRLVAPNLHRLATSETGYLPTGGWTAGWKAPQPLEAAARAGLLAQACLSDEELRPQVERLLSEHEQASASFPSTDGRTPRQGHHQQQRHEPSRVGGFLSGTVTAPES